MIMKKIFKAIYTIYYKFSYYIKPFGFYVALFQTIDFIVSYKPNNTIANYILTKKHKIILKYLEEHYKNEIENITNEIQYLEIDSSCKDFNIWQCWWQGKESLTGITKICTNSVYINSGGAPIKFITLDNYKEYVNLPDIIIQKYKNGIISLTEFSDILRANLLFENGGLWIDATILLNENIIEYIKTFNFFTCPEICKNKCFVSEYRWNTSFIGGKKKLPLFFFIKKMFDSYWAKENKLIDYYLIDYLIALAYKRIPSIRMSINHVPYNNTKKHELQPLLNTPYNEEIWKDLTNTTCVFKLSRKTKYPYKEYDSNNNLTFYGYLKRKYHKCP